MNGRTIAAVSTPKGKGGVAMIRVSGEDALQVASRVFKPAKNEAGKLSDYPSKTAVYGKFYDDQGVFDDGIALLYRSPASYTGEDVAELCCHGGLLVTKKLLAALFAAGARPASAGEFTKRAFVNGKLSLTEAEAVAGIIDAVSEKHLNVSLLQLDGALTAKLRCVYDRLALAVSSVYAYIDYPEEDMTELTVSEMKDILKEALTELQKLYESRDYGRAISEGVNAVIAGRPNTGKSSLLNLLSGEDRVIVTDIEGTTRDIVTERIVVGDVVLNLSDTAGIRESGDLIESLGIERSTKAVEGAEIIILVLENTLTPGDEGIIKLIRAAGKENVTIALYNKTDLKKAVLGGIFENELAFSAKTGEGAERLKRLIQKLCGGDKLFDDGMIVTSARQSAAMKKAMDCVKNALDALDLYTRDIAGMDIEEALSALGEIDGRRVTEEVVDTIFSHFCVGK